MAWRPRKLGVWLALSALSAALCLAGCELNPQPEVPEDDPSSNLGYDGGVGAAPDAGWSGPPTSDKRSEDDDPEEYGSVDTSNTPPNGLGTSPGRPDAGDDTDAGKSNDDMSRDAGLTNGGVIAY